MDWKRFRFWIERQKQAELIVKLFQDGYKRQADFLRDVIDAYIDDDPEFNAWMNKKRIERGNIRTRARLERKQKLITKAQELEEFLFSEQDISNIFDIIEKEN